MITLNNADERALWRGVMASAHAVPTTDPEVAADCAVAAYRDRLPKRAATPEVDPPPSPGPRPSLDDGTVVGPCGCDGATIDYTPEGARCTQCGDRWWA